MKNTKKIFLALAFVAVLLLVSAVNATDDADNGIDDTISEKTSTSTSSVIKEETPTKEKIETQKNKEIKKTNKTKDNPKKSSKTVEVTDGQSFIDAMTTFNTVETWDEGIIEFKEGTYDLSGTTQLYIQKNTKRIIINGNNQTIINHDQISTKPGYELILNNINIETQRFYNRGGIITVKNCDIKCTDLFGLKSGNIIIDDNSKLNINELRTGIWYDEGDIYINDTTVIQKLKDAGFPEENINPGVEEDTNKIIENENITQDLNIQSKYNYTITNCQINAKINNNGNLTLINCSFSNNNMTSATSKTDGFLIQNDGNLTMIDCIVENNTFNMTTIPGMGVELDLYGAIVNKGYLSVINSSFINNSVGYCYIYDELLHSSNCGNGAVFTNSGTLIIDNCNLTNNLAGRYGGAIYNQGNYTINNSLLENNTALVSGGAIYTKYESNNYELHWTITDTVFKNNMVNLTSNTLGFVGGGAISELATNDVFNRINGTGIINNCTFDNNKAMYTGDPGIGFISAIGNSILIGPTYTNISNSTFTNTGIVSGKGDIEFRSYNTITGNVFTNSTLADNIGTDITNNTFKDNSSLKINIKDNNSPNERNKQISNNKFYNNSLTTDTIQLSLLYGTPTSTLSEVMERKNITIKENTFYNTTIDDEVTLNVPNNIYTGEPITITGEYAINNPEYYDDDILEQTKFNVYINGELDQTVDTLEFTITPTSENMILTVQPTISQTRQSEAILASVLNFTLDDITATIGETTQLTAQITVTTDDTEIEVNTGRVYFKVNGKILRDAETGRILYADVTDNTATLDYPVPKTWNEDTEVTAVFAGTDDLPQKTSNTVNPTITTPETSEVEFYVSDVTTTAGSEVTITVTTKNLDAGKVVLKVNGKTVKADDGKLYAKVTGETTTFTYTVPKTYKAGDYSIKAVYTAGASKLEADAKLTIA